MKKISVILAALNEEENIGIVIDEIKTSLPQSEIIVVDNGSKDRTRDIALKKDVKVLEEKDRGKGKALMTGINEAEGDILVILDADKTYPVHSIPDMLDCLIKGNNDVVYGSRFLGKQLMISKLRKFGNRILSLIASILYRYTSDLLTGMIVVIKDRILELNLNGKGFEVETEFFIKAYKAGFKIEEIPISYIERKDSKLNPLIDGIKILKTLLKFRL